MLIVKNLDVVRRNLAHFVKLLEHFLAIFPGCQKAKERVRRRRRRKKEEKVTRCNLRGLSWGKK
jgi:hypothetical protein